MKRLLSYFSRLEITLWCSSIALILVSFLAFDRANYLTLTASLVGVTSLIFCAKGNPFGQVLMVIFSLLYGIISYTFSKLYCGIFDLPQKPFFCLGLCGKRYRPRCFMDTCKH